MYTPSEGPNPYAPPVEQDDWSAAATSDDAVLASRGRRFFGSIVDTMIYGVALVPIVVLAELPSAPEAAMIGLFGTVLVIAVIQAVLIATSGQSIAKKMLGMRIVRLDGSPIGFVHGVLLRSWVMGLLTAIPTVGGILGLVDALYIFGGEKRCLHDVMASTKVVMVEYSVSS